MRNIPALLHRSPAQRLTATCRKRGMGCPCSHCHGKDAVGKFKDAVEPFLEAGTRVLQRLKGEVACQIPHVKLTTTGAGSAQHWLQPKPHMGGTRCFFLHVPTVETPETHSSLHLFLEQTSQGRIRVALIHRRNNMAALVNEEKLEQNCAQP